MVTANNENIIVNRLSNSNEHLFFGYYDVPAFNQDSTYHLCHKVAFWDRIPEKNDVAVIGLIDMKSHDFIKLGESTAWNFQQGSMLQWHPTDFNKIIYNNRQKKSYHGIIQDIKMGAKRVLDLPVASIDPTGKFALSVNFNRMYDFRPGYGYAGITDKYEDIMAPKDDGIFLIDLDTGKTKLIFSLYEMLELTKSTLPYEYAKLMVNHITFNTDGSRFVFLARYFPIEGSRWGTATITVNTDGSDPYVLHGYDMASHYWWKDKEKLMIYANGDLGHQLYVLKDKSKEFEVLDEKFFVEDGHCSYSPDQKWLLYDSYPDKDSYRHLYLYNLEQKKGKTLGSFYSYPNIASDFRCDLHPRWNRAGDIISFDSIHEGKRDIYYIRLEDCMHLFL